MHLIQKDKLCIINAKPPLQPNVTNAANSIMSAPTRGEDSAEQLYELNPVGADTRQEQNGSPPNKEVTHTTTPSASERLDADSLAARMLDFNVTPTPNSADFSVTRVGTGSQPSQSTPPHTHTPQTIANVNLNSKTLSGGQFSGVDFRKITRSFC